MRGIKMIKKKPLTISYYKLGFSNEHPDVIRDTVSRGLLYGAIWSFYADETLENITIKMIIKDFNSKLIITSKTKYISKSKLLRLIKASSIKDITYIDKKYGFTNVNSKFSDEIYHNSKALNSLVNKL